MVRQLYHEGVNAAHQWSASYCWPEGFMRQWATGPKPNRVVVTPDVVLFMGSGSDNMWRVVHLNRQDCRSGRACRSGMETPSASGTATR